MRLDAFEEGKSAKGRQHWEITPAGEEGEEGEKIEREIEKEEAEEKEEE